MGTYLKIPYFPPFVNPRLYGSGAARGIGYLRPYEKRGIII